MSDDTEAHGDRALYSVVDGAHCFRAGPGCKPVSINMSLTGRQVEFLTRNPAAVRACLVKGAFTRRWLQALIESVEIINSSGDPRTVH